MQNCLQSSSSPQIQRHLIEQKDSHILKLLQVEGHSEFGITQRIPAPWHFPNLDNWNFLLHFHSLTTSSRHMGRCIYGGIYDPGNLLSDSNGYRTDVLSALKELDIPVIRYPGGNFIATYHWQDGIGPRENRPSRPELAWLGTETNQFGA